MAEPAIGVIGGSGLYELPGMTDVRWRRVRTPFGDPSDEYCVGRFGGRLVVFLPRHGRGHRIMPSELNFRANIWGLKSLGVEWVISVSAVGRSFSSLSDSPTGPAIACWTRSRNPIAGDSLACVSSLRAAGRGCAAT